MSARSALQRRAVVVGLGLATGVGALAVAAAPASADPTPPQSQTVTCSPGAGFYENYNSATHEPVNQLDFKHQGQTVGHTEGVHAVYDGTYAVAFDWNLQQWGVIRTDCITHH